MTGNQKRRRGFKLLPSFSVAVGRKTRMGFSLIEAAIVLAVVGLVVAGIWVSAAAVRENWKVQETAGGMLYACSKVGELWPRSMTQTSAQIGGSWAEDGGDAAGAAGAFPESWVKYSGGQNYDVTSPLGQVSNVWITASDVGWLGVNAGNILILIRGLSQAQCKKLVANTASRVSKSTSTLSGIAIKNYELPGSPYSQPYTQTDYSFPISLDSTNIDCSGTYNAIEFSCIRR